MQPFRTPPVVERPDPFPRDEFMNDEPAPVRCMFCFRSRLARFSRVTASWLPNCPCREETLAGLLRRCTGPWYYAISSFFGVD
jgi:hypothetical protein